MFCLSDLNKGWTANWFSGILSFAEIFRFLHLKDLSNWNGSFPWTVPTVKPLYAASQGSHIPCYNATQCLKKECALMNCICKKKNKQHSTNLAAALYFLGSARERNWRSQGCHSYCIQGDQCESLSPGRRQNKQTNTRCSQTHVAERIPLLVLVKHRFQTWHEAEVVFWRGAETWLVDGGDKEKKKISFHSSA